MNPLITYDVSGRQPEIKKAMIDLGYMDVWTYENKTYYLPDTTLWKKDRELADSLVDIQSVITKLNQGQPGNKKIRLERCVCISALPWVAIPVINTPKNSASIC